MPQTNAVRRHNGSAVRNARYVRRMTLQELADSTGISKPFLSRIENERKGALLKTLDLIADALGVPVWTLLREPWATEVRQVSARATAGTGRAA